MAMDARRSRTGMPWAGMFDLLHQQKFKHSPLHVRVLEADLSVSHVCAGNELFLHDIKIEEIALRCDTENQTKSNVERQNINVYDEENHVEINLPVEYTEKFVLFPRFPMSHRFLSIQEILDALPAVSRVIYPVDGFTVAGQSVRGMERLEITDRVQDPHGGTEVLHVYSLKNERQLLLPASLKIPFVQISNECYKCTSAGLQVKDFIRSWKPGEPPFRVKLCDVLNKEVEKSSTKIAKKLKKQNKKKHHSCDLKNLNVTDLATYSSDRWLLPKEWWDKVLLIRPFQTMRVSNISYNAKDFYLPDSCKMTVMLLSKEANAAAKAVPENPVVSKHRVLSRTESYCGSIVDVPSEFLLSNGKAQLMVTGGSASTSLRQKSTIMAGDRIAVHEIRQLTKLVITCEDGRFFLVSKAYSGRFESIQGGRTDLTVKELLQPEQPRRIRVTQKDFKLGYDPLEKRRELTIKEAVREAVLVVSIISADGRVLSEQPFEMSLPRSAHLLVRVVESSSLNIDTRTGRPTVKTLPSVEFVSDKDISLVKSSQQRSVLPQGTSGPATNGIPNEIALPPRPRKSSNVIDKSRGIFLDTDTPPPVPPKSPILKHSTLTMDMYSCVNKSMAQTGPFSPTPPDRPPKPKKFTTEHMGEQFIYLDHQKSSNNNNNERAEQIMDQKLKKSSILSARQAEWKEKNRTSVVELQDLLYDSQMLLSQVTQSDADTGNQWRNLERSSELTLDPAPTNESLSPKEVKQTLTTFERTDIDAAKFKDRKLPDKAAQRAKIIEKKLATRKDFKDMHYWFAPERVDDLTALNELKMKQKMEKAKIIDVSNNNLEAAIYDSGTCQDRSNQRHPRGFWKRTKKNGGISIENPNYDVELGVTHFCSEAESEEKSPSDDEMFYDEPLYDFAHDVAEFQHRSNLSSFVDDIGEYETPSSPK